MLDIEVSICALCCAVLCFAYFITYLLVPSEAKFRSVFLTNSVVPSVLPGTAAAFKIVGLP